MHAIWKFKLDICDRQSIALPKGAKILCVQTQKETPCIWAIVSNTKDGGKQYHSFAIYGTGHEHEAIGGTYIGTFQLQEGMFVYHVFEF